MGQPGFGEEWIILDFEAPFPIHEYQSIDELNEWAEQLDNLPDFLIDNLKEALDYEDFETILMNEGENFCLYSDASDDSGLAYAIVDEVYGGEENLPQNILQSYFDYEAFGRDIAIETSGFYGNGGYIEYRN